MMNVNVNTHYVGYYYKYEDDCNIKNIRTIRLMKSSTILAHDISVDKMKLTNKQVVFSQNSQNRYL